MPKNCKKKIIGLFLKDKSRERKEELDVDYESMIDILVCDRITGKDTEYKIRNHEQY